MSRVGQDIVSISGSTKVYAVFGDPVAQVQTPRLINPIFARNETEIIAVPFHVTSQIFDVTWQSFQAISNTAGVGLTIPHKMSAAKACDTLTPAAKAVGVVNSVKRTSSGLMHGALFDGLGFIEGLGEGAKSLIGAKVLLIGAGGAGRAIAYALIEAGISSLTVIDKSADAVLSCSAMVDESSGRSLTNNKLHEVGVYDTLINATPAGLKAGDAFPIDLESLHSAVMVADIASLSRQTELLKIAKYLGCRTSDGNDMLTAQISMIAGWAAGGDEGSTLS